jgi:hypothetical protein
MSRPEFVSNEDIIRWADNIDNDVNIPKILANEPLMREVMYSGLWLAEQLKQLQCNDALIPRIQYLAGSLSFGHDPWVVVQEVLQAYNNNDLEYEMDYDA